MNATSTQTTVQFLSETPAADQMDWMADMEAERRLVLAQMAEPELTPEQLQDIQDEKDAIVAHAFAEVDAAIAAEAHLAVCKSSNGVSVFPNDTMVINVSNVDQIEAMFMQIVGSIPMKGYVWIARGEAHSTFNEAYKVASTPKAGCTRGEPFMEWLSIDDFDFGSSGELYIGDTKKQAAHAFAVWLERKVIKEAA